METVETVSRTAGTGVTPGSAPRAASSASHATAQHWPTPECSTAPEGPAFQVFPAEPFGPGPLGPEPLGPEPLDLVTVPARQGLEAVDILRRASAALSADTDGAAPSAVGPVLHDGPCDTLGFLVPPGTADGWDLPGSACTQTFGRGVSFDVPAAGAGGSDRSARSAESAGGTAAGSAPVRAEGPGAPVVAVPEPPVTGTDWLLPPTTDTVPVTDPAVLRRALGEAARLIEAADRCR